MSLPQLAHAHLPDSLPLQLANLGYGVASIAHVSPFGVFVLEPVKSFHEETYVLLRNLPNGLFS